MPRLTGDMENHKIGGTNYGFSAKRIDQLGASEYTLTGIAADRSGSVSAFQLEIEKCIKEIVKSCRLSPRADNLLLRVTTFDNALAEVHGFKPLSECDLDGYKGCIAPGGTTAAFDATHNNIEAMSLYAQDLVKQDYSVNGILFVITDGDDNASAMGMKQVKEAFDKAKKTEALESLVSVLIGVNVKEPALSQYLKNFQTQAGFTQYIEIDNASEKSLARLADFVSKSISAQSQALGTGGPSKALTF